MNEQQYSPTGFRVLPTVVKHLLIINGLLYLAYYVLAKQEIINLNALLGIWSLSSGLFHVWQPLTYMFMHGNFEHLFFNMFSLWMFGATLENYWGSQRFLFYYLVCGIGAGLLNMLVPGVHVSVGASGAVYGLFLAFGMSFPKDYVYVLIWIPILFVASILFRGTTIGAFLDQYSLLLFLLIIFIVGRTGKGLVRIQNRWFVIAMVAIELFMGLFIIDGVAHFAHLGGMLIGLLLILYWKKYGNLSRDLNLKDWFQSLKRRRKMKYTRYTEVKDEPQAPRFDEEYNYQKAQKERDIDAILDKVAKDGYGSLTPEEKEFLFKNSR